MDLSQEIRGGNQFLLLKDASDGHSCVGVSSQQLGVAGTVWQHEWLHFSVTCEPAQLIGEADNRTVTTAKAANSRAVLWQWRFMSVERDSFCLDKVDTGKGRNEFGLTDHLDAQTGHSFRAFPVIIRNLRKGSGANDELEQSE